MYIPYTMQETDRIVKTITSLRRFNKSVNKLSKMIAITELQLPFLIIQQFINDVFAGIECLNYIECQHQIIVFNIL